MKNKLFVGNLPWSVDSEKLREIFSAYGEITDATVLTDKFTGRSRGFGFVEYKTDEEAAAAVDALDGSNLEGRDIVVNVARPKTEE